MDGLIFKSLSEWDGESDVILVASGKNGLEAKICPANILHDVLRQYRDFIKSHELVFETTVLDNQMFVVMRWDDQAIMRRNHETSSD